MHCFRLSRFVHKTWARAYSHRIFQYLANPRAKARWTLSNPAQWYFLCRSHTLAVY
jgi:hypothetical protein